MTQKHRQPLAKISGPAIFPVETQFSALALATKVLVAAGFDKKEVGLMKGDLLFVVANAVLDTRWAIVPAPEISIQSKGGLKVVKAKRLDCHERMLKAEALSAKYPNKNIKELYHEVANNMPIKIGYKQFQAEWKKYREQRDRIWQKMFLGRLGLSDWPGKNLVS